MKMKLLAPVLGLAIALALAGCALRPTLPAIQEATISRHFAAPAPAVLAAIKRSAIARGFAEKSAGVFERAAGYPVDPILGIVRTSDVPNSFFRVTIETSENNTGTLVRCVPSTYSPGSKYPPFYWRPGTEASAVAVALLDSAIAEQLASGGRPADDPTP